MIKNITCFFVVVLEAIWEKFPNSGQAAYDLGKLSFNNRGPKLKSAAKKKKPTGDGGFLSDSENDGFSSFN